MNIIYARMPGYDFVSTPSDAVFRELEKLGHRVFWVENLGYLPSDKFDVVVSPYESVTMLGDAVSKRLGIPHIAHIEWLPPWRVKKVDSLQYGIPEGDEELKALDQMSAHYKMVGQAWLKADSMLLGGAAFRGYLKEFLATSDEDRAKIDNCVIRHPSVDTVMIDSAKRMYSPNRDPQRILTVSRAVPNKRYDLLLQVINKITVPTIWAIVGDGPEIDMIKEKLDNENIQLDIVGPGWGWGKLYEMMKSTIYLGGWTGMPPIEAALLGCYPVCVRPAETNEKVVKVLDENFNGHIEMYDEVDIDKIAKVLDGYLTNPTVLTGQCEDLGTMLHNGDLGVKTSKQNALELENTIIGVINCPTTCQSV